MSVREGPTTSQEPVSSPARRGLSERLELEMMIMARRRGGIHELHGEAASGHALKSLGREGQPVSNPVRVYLNGRGVGLRGRVSNHGGGHCVA